jgi:4'-phosphopantetheinyl transferase
MSPIRIRRICSRILSATRLSCRGVADRAALASEPAWTFETALRRHGLDAQSLTSADSGFPMWLIDTEDFEPRALESLLAKDEQIAADRFRRPALRTRYIAAHGGLRILLRDEYGIPLDAQAVERNGFGKPSLTRYPQLHYSVSYSDRFVLIGINDGEPIGVDIEVLRPIEDAVELMDTHFTPAEQAKVRSGGHSGTCLSRNFLDIWVRKEACLKALGCGLNIPLNSVECWPGDQMTTVQLSDSQFRTGALQYLGDPIMAWSRRIRV